MTLYDEIGNAVEIEEYDGNNFVESEEFYKLLQSYSESLENIEQCQADILTATQEQNDILTEMNQYVAYIFVIVLAVMLYRILCSALSSLFGGG